MITYVVVKQWNEIKHENRTPFDVVDGSGKREEITRQKLKAGIKAGSLNVLNMKLAKNDRLVFKGTEELVETIAPVIVPIMQKFYINRWVTLASNMMFEYTSALIKALGRSMYCEFGCFYEEDWYNSISESKKVKLYPYLRIMSNLICWDNDKAISLLVKKMIIRAAGEEKKLIYCIDFADYLGVCLSQVENKIEIKDGSDIAYYLIQVNRRSFNIIEN